MTYPPDVLSYVSFAVYREFLAVHRLAAY